MHLDKMANYGNNDMYEYEMSIKKKKTSTFQSNYLKFFFFSW